MVDSTKMGGEAKKAWNAPSIADFRVEDVTHTGGTEVQDGFAGTNEGDPTGS